MKIKVETGSYTLSCLIELVAAIAAIFGADPKKLHEELAKTLLRDGGKNIDRRFAGGHITYGSGEYGDDPSFQFELDDEAVLAIIPWIAKLIKILTPIYGIIKSLKELCGNITTHLNDVSRDMKADYLKKFGKKPSFVVFALMEESIEAGDVVIVRDDGYGNDDSIRVIRALHCWSVNNLDILTKVVKTKYRDHLSFSEMTEDEAIKKAEAMRPSVEADVNGTIEALNEKKVKKVF